MSIGHGINSGQWDIGSKVFIVLTLENPEKSSLDFFLFAYDWSNDTEGLGDDSEALGTTVHQEWRLLDP